MLLLFGPELQVSEQRDSIAVATFQSGPLENPSCIAHAGGRGITLETLYLHIFKDASITTSVKAAVYAV
jgi:hypothetical protein